MSEDREIDQVVGEYTGRARVVLEYAATTGRLVRAAKSPGFTADDWEPLAALVAVDEFERVGAFKEEMRWPEYVGFLTGWATSSEWDCSFKRVTEAGGRIFLELEERSTVGEFRSVVNSLSVYEFDAEDKITRIDLYLQMALPATDMVPSFDGVESTQ